MSHTYRKHDPVILLDRIHNGRRGHVCMPSARCNGRNTTASTLADAATFATCI